MKGRTVLANLNSSSAIHTSYDSWKLDWKLWASLGERVHTVQLCFLILLFFIRFSGMGTDCPFSSLCTLCPNLQKTNPQTLTCKSFKWLEKKNIIADVNGRLLLGLICTCFYSFFCFLCRRAWSRNSCWSVIKLMAVQFSGSEL